MRFEKLLLAAAALCLVCMAPACSDDDPATDPEQNETPGTPGEGEGDGDDDSGEPGEPDTPDTPALTEGVRAEGYYKGDYHDEGTGNYWINFTVEDENDPGGYYILCLDFNGSLAADPDFAALDVRDYPMNVGSGYPAGTLNGDGDTYLARHDDEGDFTYSEAQSGSAKVEMIEGLYKVTCSLLLENDEVCDFEYYGPLAFYNRTLDGNMSNLTEDVELTFTQGMAIYYGDIYEMGSDAWNVVLAEADYDLDINYGQGDAVQLAFNVTHGAGDYIPDGPYTLLDANTAEELPAGMKCYRSPKSYNSQLGVPLSVLMIEGDEQLALIEAGISKPGEMARLERIIREGDIYTLELKLKDGAGRNVTATYTGKLTYYSGE